MEQNALPAITVLSTGGVQTNVPFTIGHVFGIGHLARTDGLMAGTVPLQVDVKALHVDGSVRHAILSGVVPKLDPAAPAKLQLAKVKRSKDLPNTDQQILKASVRLNIAGTNYQFSNEKTFVFRDFQVWLAGQIVNEVTFGAPLTAEDTAEHPHLSLRVGFRFYPGTNKIRLDVTVENDWAFEPNPQNFVYDAEITIAGKVVYSQKAMTHLHHTRWRKVFWTDGIEPQIHLQHDPAYLMATGMVPNYDPTLKIPEWAIVDQMNAWQKSPRAPMNTGMIANYMPMTGGRRDIGLLPAWDVMWLLSQDTRAKEVSLGNADLAGSFSAHYRNKDTGRPITLNDRPYMTILGNPGDAFNWQTKVSDYFPWFDGSKNPTPNTHDSAHQPAMSYFAYLTTGDFFHLEELHFWANFNLFSTNPGYRQNVRGLFNSMQVRAQAWSLRTLGQAAAITPDGHPDKAGFQYWLDQNLDDYISRYVGDKNNALGVIVDGAAYSYRGDNGIAPWQDDFFTSAIGHLIELGFPKAQKLMEWKAKFAIGRLTDPDYCFVDAAMYDMQIRKDKSSPVFKTLAEVYAASADPKLIELKCNSVEQLAYRNSKRVKDDGPEFQLGEIVGLASSNMGYVSNLQPAAAMAADYAGDAGKKAWKVFDGRTTKPDYSYAPQFAIVPRTVKSQPIVTPTPAPAPAPTTPVPVKAGIDLIPAPTEAGDWKRIAGENEKVTLSVGDRVRYGSAKKGCLYGKANVAGEIKASNDIFSPDPAPGVVKQLDLFVPATPPAPPSPPPPKYRVYPVTKYVLSEVSTGDKGVEILTTMAEFDMKEDAEFVIAALEKGNVA